jgi:hypothetical protein
VNDLMGEFLSRALLKSIAETGEGLGLKSGKQWVSMVHS